MMSESSPLLRVAGLTKRFYGVTALNDVSFDIHAGVIHALVGENGAGKSTLMKTIVGVHTPDEGHLELDGERVEIHDPAHANRLGIDIVYQEIEVAPNLTVAENIFLAREPRRRGRIDYDRMFTQADTALRRLDVDLPLDRPVEELGLAARQLVQIARALTFNTRLLIMDEPTSALSDNECEHLFTVLNSLRADGTTILYVSHKLDEVFRLADTVTVLRDGRHIATEPCGAVDRDRLISLMTGAKSMSAVIHDLSAAPDAPVVLSVDGLTGGNTVTFTNVSLRLHCGEVLGIFGIVGAGRSELAGAIFGVEPVTAGTVHCGAVRLTRHSPRDAIRHGIALVPEDRKLQGLVLEMSLLWNMSLAALPTLQTGGMISPAREHRLAAAAVDQLSIATTSLDKEVQDLSGGNQQKVVIAKWLATQPKVLILDEPTRGIDVGAKREVHLLVRRLAADGLGVLLISSEIDEAVELSDRLIVMREGRITAELDPRTCSREEVLSHAVP